MVCNSKDKGRRLAVREGQLPVDLKIRLALDPQAGFRFIEAEEEKRVDAILAQLDAPDRLLLERFRALVHQHVVPRVFWQQIYRYFRYDEGGITSNLMRWWRRVPESYEVMSRMKENVKLRMVALNDAARILCKEDMVMAWWSYEACVRYLRHLAVSTAQEVEGDPLSFFPFEADGGSSSDFITEKMLKQAVEKEAYGEA